MIPSLRQPTKGRARKPRKDRDAKPVQRQGIPSTPTSGTNLSSHMERSASTATIRTESLAIPSLSTPRTITSPNARHANGKLEQSRTNLSSDDLPLLSRVTDEQTDQAIIAVKPLSSNTPIESSSAPKNPNGSLDRRPLHGTTTSTPTPSSEMLKHDIKPERSSGHHTRILSTGNRATLMDVAQAWVEQPVGALSATANAEAAAMSHEDTIQGESPEIIERRAEALPQRRHITPPNVQAEKRKSSYEKYSATILPSLPEEKTPASSTMVTLSRSATKDQLGQGGVDKYGLDSKRISRSLEVASNIDANLVHFGEAHRPRHVQLSDRSMCRSHRRTPSTDRYQRLGGRKRPQMYAQPVRSNDIDRCYAHREEYSSLYIKGYPCVLRHRSISYYPPLQVQVQRLGVYQGVELAGQTESLWQQRRPQTTGACQALWNQPCKSALHKVGQLAHDNRTYRKLCTNIKSHQN